MTVSDSPEYVTLRLLFLAINRIGKKRVIIAVYIQFMFT